MHLSGLVVAMVLEEQLELVLAAAAEVSTNIHLGKLHILRGNPSRRFLAQMIPSTTPLR